jgi:serine/threonine protein kinase
LSFWESSGGEYLDTFLNELQRAVEEQGNGDFTATISVQLMNQLPPSDPNYDTEQIATPVNIQKPEHPYVTREQIGIGGAATVDAAAQTCLQREVALKRPRKDQTQSSANQIVREALLLARLEHPNIPPVYTLDYDAQGLPVMVMKRIKGKPWSAHLQKVSQTERATIEWQRRQLENLVKICNALTYAHD